MARLCLNMLFMKSLVCDHLRSGERTVTTLVVAPREPDTPADPLD